MGNPTNGSCTVACNGVGFTHRQRNGRDEMSNTTAMNNLINESRRLWSLYMSLDQGDAADEICRRYHLCCEAIARRAAQEKAALQ